MRLTDEIICEPNESNKMTRANNMGINLYSALELEGKFKKNSDKLIHDNQGRLGARLITLFWSSNREILSLCSHWSENSSITFMFVGSEPGISHILVLLIYLLTVEIFYVVDNDLWVDLCLIKIQDIDTVLIRYIPGIHVYRLSMLFSGLLASV